MGYHFEKLTYLLAISKEGRQGRNNGIDYIVGDYIGAAMGFYASSPC